MAAILRTTVAAHNSMLSPRAPPRGGPLGFFAPSEGRLLPPRSASRRRVTMRMATKQAYICRDCGYIYSDRNPFEKLPDSFFCPVCGAPKRRFKPYEPTVSKNANSTDVRKARKAQLKRDEAIGNSLPIGIAVGVALLAALYFYLNNVYS